MLKPPASKLASQVSFCRGVLSAANCPIQKVPLEIWEHLCKAPLACFCPTLSLPSHCQWCWIPASSRELRNATRHWGLEKQGRKLLLVQVFPKWKLFSWELVLGREAYATVCPEMGPDLIFFATELDQALVPLNALQNGWSCNIHDREHNWERNPFSRASFFLWLFLGYVVFPPSFFCSIFFLMVWRVRSVQQCLAAWALQGT